MEKRRVGNDFFAAMQVTDYGNLVDLISVKDTVEITCRAGFKLLNVELFEILENGIIRIEIKSEIYNNLGQHRFFVKYNHPDASMSDNNRKRELDKVLFELVPTSEQADVNEDVFVTVDIGTGFVGKSSYEYYLENTTDNPKLTETEFADKLAVIPQKIEEVETATQAAKNATTDSVAKTALAVTATQAANTAKESADTATRNANDATGTLNSKLESVDTKMSNVDATLTGWGETLNAQVEEVDTKIEVVDEKVIEWDETIETKKSEVDTKIEEIETEAVDWRNAETLRDEAEVIRKSNNENILTSENNRIENENIRKQNEIERIANYELMNIKHVTITLLSNGWVNLKQEITVPEILADSYVIISVTPEKLEAIEYAEKYVYCIKQEAGKLTFEAYSKPAIDINLNLEIKKLS